jgi:phage tail-like protein
VKAGEFEAILPAVFRNALPGDATLASLLDVMESFADPVDERLGTLERIFDALSTAGRFAPMLARWVDLEWLYADADETDPMVAARAWLDSGLPIGRLRLLIEQSHALAQARGTARGLVRFLEIATGIKGFAVSDASQGAAPFHLRVFIPDAAKAQSALIERIVNAEKPAYATWEAVSNIETGA